MSLIGPSVQASATKWFEVVLGRCISGMGIGFALNFAIAYWTETTPASLRGSVVVLYQGITNVAQFVAQCVNQGTHTMDTRGIQDSTVARTAGAGSSARISFLDPRHPTYDERFPVQYLVLINLRLVFVSRERRERAYCTATHSRPDLF